MGHRLLAALVSLASLVSCLGCGAAQPKQSGSDDDFNAKPSDSASADMSASKDDDAKPASRPASRPTPAKSGSPVDDLNDAQQEQLKIALLRGTKKSANCDKVVPGTAVGTGDVTVTFDGKKGRAIGVVVPPPWAGTDAESCIKQAFLNEIVVPFDGQLEVPCTITVGHKDDATTTPAKGAKKK